MDGKTVETLARGMEPWTRSGGCSPMCRMNERMQRKERRHGSFDVSAIESIGRMHFPCNKCLVLVDVA